MAKLNVVLSFVAFVLAALTHNPGAAWMSIGAMCGWCRVVHLENK